MTGYEMLGLAIIVGGSLWCIAGDVQLALTIYPSDAVQCFQQDEVGLYVLDSSSLPRFRREAWLKAINDLVYRGLAMNYEGQWILTDRGEELRRFSQISA
jgi:hypothetical protein